LNGREDLPPTSMEMTGDTKECFVKTIKFSSVILLNTGHVNGLICRYSWKRNDEITPYSTRPTVSI